MARARTPVLKLSIFWLSIKLLYLFGLLLILNIVIYWEPEDPYEEERPMLLVAFLVSPMVSVIY